jgi:hypothetical protein
MIMPLFYAVSAPGPREKSDSIQSIKEKYAKKYSKGTNIVVLDPDVAKVFKDSASVNDILRSIARIAAQIVKYEKNL